MTNEPKDKPESCGLRKRGTGISMNDIIKIDHLSKSFGEVKAVQDLSFRVKEGELFAFLGINGAGKSTTINIMCGQLAKDGGAVEIDGADLDRDPDHIRRELGVVFQSSVLDGALSVRDNLKSRAALYGIRGAAFAQRAGSARGGGYIHIGSSLLSSIWPLTGPSVCAFRTEGGEGSHCITGVYYGYKLPFMQETRGAMRALKASASRFEIRTEI